MNKAIMNVRMKKWARILQEAAASGLPKVTWCEQNEINRRQFFHWQKKIREYILEQHPEIGLSVPDGQVRAVNNQMTSSLLIFCELKPQATMPTPTADNPDAPFSAEAMIQLGQCRVYVGNMTSERILSLILSVIQHA